MLRKTVNQIHEATWEALKGLDSPGPEAPEAKVSITFRVSVRDAAQPESFMTHYIRPVFQSLSRGMLGTRPLKAPQVTSHPCPVLGPKPFSEVMTSSNSEIYLRTTGVFDQKVIAYDLTLEVCSMSQPPTIDKPFVSEVQGHPYSKETKDAWPTKNQRRPKRLS